MKKLLLLLLIGLLGLNCQAFAYDFEQIQIHGFVSQGYLQSDKYDYFQVNTAEGTFEFNEFGLNVMANLSDRLRAGMQLFSRDFGDVGNNKVTIDWAFGDYRYRNWLGLRAGKMKRVLGLYNQSRDIDAARTGVFLPTSVYSEATRNFQKSIIGIAVYGWFPGGFEYQAQYGTLDPEVAEDMLKNSDTKSVELGESYALALTWNTPLDGLRVRGTVSGFSVKQTRSFERDEETIEETMEMDLTEPIVGVEYLRDPLTLAAEYRQVRDERSTSEAYYGLCSYRVNDWFEVGASYAVRYADKDDRDGEGFEQRGEPKARAWLKDLALSTRFDINEFWVVKLEGHWLDGLFDVSGYDDDPDENGFLGAAKVTFSF